ncbi:MAG: diguanylate cyclase [Desulfobacteraceae bacterium]|nr:diguanylate cyclase [Desulfobacteraceae bacterium]
METDGLKVLVVDDDPLVREIIYEILSARGYLVETAINGIDALDHLGSNKSLNLILTDMDMPEMNGLELLEQIKTIKIDIPIIILTANEEISIAIKALKNGADDYIIKDENIGDTLLISIDQTMEQQRLKKQNIQLLLDLERKNKELERMALLDGLTSIPNRHYLEKVLQREWKNCRRNQSHFGLIMADIDFFKSYNDTYGHPKGDKCLQRVARAMNNAINRPADFIARYGGEEFTVILPDTKIDGTKHVAEKIKFNVEALGIPHKASKAVDHITISIGIGSMVPHKSIKYSYLLDLVDKALYKAKDEGRNCIRMI